MTFDDESPDWWLGQQSLEHEQYLTQPETKGTGMKAGAMMESKFLKKEDLDYDNGNLVTISRIEQQNVGAADGEEELKWCMSFKEFRKPMVLNSTNIQLVTKALGTDETDEWIGKKIVVYVDDNVSFGGKLVGGIRVRKVRGQAASSKPEPKSVTGASGRSFEEEMDSDVPF